MNNEFQQEFLEEAKQVLKQLEHSLLELEKKATPDEINNTYRFLHTIKGGAGMFGFHTAERLAHELESVYSDVRDGLRQHDEFILDLALHTVDVLGELLEGNGDEKEVEKIIQSIGGLREGGDLNSAENTEKTAEKLEYFAILLRPHKEIFKRGVNLVSLLDEVQELGSNELIVHNETIPFEKQLAEKKIVSSFEIILATKSGVEVVRDVFMFMREDEFKIIPITDAQTFSTSLYQQEIQLNQAEIERRVKLVQDFAPELLTKKDDSPQKLVPNQDNALVADIEESQQSDGVKISKSRKGGHVSVATQKLDQLINIVSELVIFRSEIGHLMSANQSPAVTEAMEKLERLTLGLRDSAFNIRLVPLNVLNVKLQRLIRGVSKELGKEIDFITEGLDTELDRSMITALEAPLMHLIRNAMDHGIERPEEREANNKPRKGLLKLYSYNSGDHVFIQVQDDGRGIDFDKIRAKGVEKGLIGKNQSCTEKELINLMMTPGFSTAEKVTTVSGRGVGMDVVKRDIASMRGDIEVSTEKGLGSIFTMRLPLTLTVLDTLVVEVADHKYLIPINEVEHCYKEKHAKLFHKNSRQINYQGQLTQFVSLREHFEINDYREEETVIVVNKNDTRIAVVVDGIIGKLQTVYKPLNDLLPVDCFSGSSILGDGSMALILNALKLKN